MLTQVVRGRTYDFSHAVGRRDWGHPVGVAIGPGDDVYILTKQQEQVADVPWNETAIYAKVGKHTIGTVPGDEERVGEFGGYGDTEGKLIWPVGIALDSEQNVYVTDEWLNRVSVFNNNGEFAERWGKDGDRDGEFNRPSGIAVDAKDNLYVVDSLNHRVQKFKPDGTFLAGWGSLGSGEGELDSPWGIGIDADGYVYVADHKNHRAQKFTPDGDYVASFGAYGSGPGELNRPADVTVDPEGDVYVCDWANNRVQTFAPDGSFIASHIGDAERLAKWQQQQVDANADVIKARRRVYSLEPEWRLTLPTAVEFDSEKSRLFVADTQRARVQIYNKLSDYTEPQFNL